MLITILTPTLNCVRTLEDTLNSVRLLEQLYPGQIEHLLGDGGSSDGTLELIERHAYGNSWVKYYVFRKMNIPATLNKLLVGASGEFVMVLNGDDYFDIAGMTKLLNELHNYSDAEMICGDVEVLSESGASLGFRNCRIESLDRFMSINHPALLAKRYIFNIVGLFNTGASSSYDYLWVWRAYKHNVRFSCCNISLALVRLGGISQYAASKAAREILFAKIADRCIAQPLRNYVVFKLKAIIKVIIPKAASDLLVAKYRAKNNSIDKYSE